MVNLLRNPSFEGEFRPWNNISEIHVADGWTPFWVEQEPDDEPWRNRRPEFKRATLAIDPNRVRSGQSAQQYFSFWGTHIAGLLQQVSVRSGQRLRFRAYGHAWSSNQDRPDLSVDPGNVRMKIGIDATGGTNPFSSAVVWSDERMVYDRYDERGFEVEAVAQGAVVTVFLFSAPEWPKKHTDIYWDDASVVVVGEADRPAPQPEAEKVSLRLQSTTGRVGTPVLVRATSQLGLTNVRIKVRGPGGAVGVRWLGLGPGGLGYVWSWEFMPSQEGEYEAIFKADGIDSVRATARVVGAQPPVQPVQPVEPHGLSGESEVVTPSSSARGLPRVQYARTYVLLPQSAGGAWLRALRRSGVLERHKWTVGYSADDAGVGDLDMRTVIVINPGEWPDPIVPWLQRWYPGVVVRTLKASTPDELEAKLASM